MKAPWYWTPRVMRAIKAARARGVTVVQVADTLGVDTRSVYALFSKRRWTVWEEAEAIGRLDALNGAARIGCPLTGPRPVYGQKRRAAAELLVSLLARGPLPAQEVLAKANSLNIGRETLKFARRDLGVVSTKRGAGPFWLSLPDMETAE